jgi:tetratricopeptide (TPR) repeat protein
MALVHIAAGIVGGFVLAWPLGLLSEASPGMPPLLIGLPLAAASMAGLSGWIIAGRLPELLPAIGVAVLLVNLLAAGGIGFPAVADSLWLLLALGLNRLEANRPLRNLPRGVGTAGLIVAITLAAACYSSAYNPVLRYHQAVEMAKEALAHRNPDQAERHLREAAKADPLAVKPWQQLAALTFARWQQHPGEQTFRAFESYNAEALKRVPDSSAAHLLSGDWYLAAYRKTHRKDYVNKALEDYRAAVERYPNSALCQAKLALAYKAADQPSQFRRQADEALRLDRVTPHVDKKLPPALRRQLLPAAGGR